MAALKAVQRACELYERAGYRTLVLTLLLKPKLRAGKPGAYYRTVTFAVGPPPRLTLDDKSNAICFTGGEHKGTLTCVKCDWLIRMPEFAKIGVPRRKYSDRDGESFRWKTLTRRSFG
jgi:hypothetical protein